MSVSWDEKSSQKRKRSFSQSEATWGCLFMWKTFFCWGDPKKWSMLHWLLFYLVGTKVYVAVK